MCFAIILVAIWSRLPNENSNLFLHSPGSCPTIYRPNSFVIFVRWLEQDPLEILQTTIACIESLSQTSLDLSEIVSVGITNQRETTIVWDKTTGKPFYNAIGKLTCVNRVDRF